MKKIPRWIYAAIIAAALVLIYVLTPLKEVVNWQRIYENRDTLIDYVRGRFLLSTLVFVGIYFLTVSLSIPGATVLSVSGGFFFGPLVGTLLVNIGATAGALALFLAARYFIGAGVQRKYADQLLRFNREIEENGKNYLLTLRLIPVFPFFLINLLAGLTTVKVSTFAWTTALGIIPGSFVYTYLGSAGAGLDETRGVFSSEILIALLLLAVLSLIPVAVRKIKRIKEARIEEVQP